MLIGHFLPNKITIIRETENWGQAGFWSLSLIPSKQKFVATPLLTRLGRTPTKQGMVPTERAPSTRSKSLQDRRPHLVRMLFQF